MCDIDSSFDNSQSDDVASLLDSNDDDNNNSNNNSTLKFSLEISNDDWKKMEPEKVVYRDKAKKARSYVVLKRHIWTNIVNGYFWAALKLPCKMIYKRSRISESADANNYCTIKGKVH